MKKAARKNYLRIPFSLNGENLRKTLKAYLYAHKQEKE